MNKDELKEWFRVIRYGRSKGEEVRKKIELIPCGTVASRTFKGIDVAVAKARLYDRLEKRAREKGAPILELHDPRETRRMLYLSGETYRIPDTVLGRLEAYFIAVCFRQSPDGSLGPFDLPLPTADPDWVLGGKTINDSVEAHNALGDSPNIRRQYEAQAKPIEERIGVLRGAGATELPEAQAELWKLATRMRDDLNEFYQGLPKDTVITTFFGFAKGNRPRSSLAEL